MLQNDLICNWSLKKVVKLKSSWNKVLLKWCKRKNPVKLTETYQLREQTKFTALSAFFTGFFTQYSVIKTNWDCWDFSCTVCLVQKIWSNSVIKVKIGTSRLADKVRHLDLSSIQSSFLYSIPKGVVRCPLKWSEGSAIYLCNKSCHISRVWGSFVLIINT